MKMKNLTRQLVHMHKPYRSKFIDGRNVIVHLGTNEEVATIHNSTLFRDLLVEHGCHARGYFLTPGDRPDLVQLNNAVLYNCRTRNLAPDWSKYVALILKPMADFDGRSEIAEPGCDVNFYCVFGIDTNGMYEPITDCTTPAMANLCIAELARLSGLPVNSEEVR